MHWECYNSSLDNIERINILYKFAFNEIECVVATVAFGMGLDKPDIRMIINYGAPKKMKTYLQGAGRVGAVAPDGLWIFMDLASI